MNAQEWSKYEVLHGPPQRESLFFRASIPMRQHLEELARFHRTSYSSVVRHAVAKYIEEQGKAPFVYP